MGKDPKKYKPINYDSPYGKEYMKKYDEASKDWDTVFAAYKQQYPDTTYSQEKFIELAHEGKEGQVHDFIKGYSTQTPFKPVTIDPKKRMDGSIISKEPADPAGTYMGTAPSFEYQVGENVKQSSTQSPPAKDQSWKDDLAYFNPLRMAPVFEAFGNVFNQDPADNTLASSIRNAYRPVDYQPFGERATATPFDWRTFTIAQRAKDRANQQAIIGASGGNNAAAMASLAQNNMTRQGDLATSHLQGIEYNNKQSLGLLGFNNALDQANKQYQTQIDQYNSSKEYQSLTGAAQVWDQEKKLIEQVTSQNRSALSNTLGSLGQDYINYSLIKNNPAFLYSPIFQNLKQPKTE